MSTAPVKSSSAPVAAIKKQDPAGLVADYPITSVLIVFGIGLGAGVAIGSLLGGTVAPRPSLGRRTEQAAEQLGRQVLDAISGVLPASLAKHSGS